MSLRISDMDFRLHRSITKEAVAKIRFFLTVGSWV
jgi:hypothetical protein